MGTAETPQVLRHSRGMSIASLAKLLFRSEIPDDQLRGLPAQTLYLAAKHLGVASCADILEAASVEQCRLLLDFDCWTKDRLNEDNFWEWLSIADEEHGLKILQKLVKSVDLKIISLMISRYVQAEIFDDKTENPPGPGYASPDQGFTWVLVTHPEETRNFLLTRLLALIFETDAELFYQLLAIPGVTTDSMLEDEAFSERQKRLSAEGIPDAELAAEVHSPITREAALKALSTSKNHPTPQDISVVEPIVYEGSRLEPLASLHAELPNSFEFESELTFIMNAAVVRWAVDFHEQDRVKHTLAKVCGAINIGLEVLIAESKLSSLAIFEKLGLQKIYSLGLSELSSLHRFARKISTTEAQALADNQAYFALLAGAREIFPECPEFLQADGSFKSEDGRMASGYRAFEHSREIGFVLDKLRQHFSSPS